jgi:hypothetical protein
MGRSYVRTRELPISFCWFSGASYRRVDAAR